MVQYVSFRVDLTAIFSHSVVHGYFVRGQRSSDYNWPLLGTFDSMSSALEFIDSLRSSSQVVYGPNGYALKV